MRRAILKNKMYSPSIQKLIDLFSKFPTVGPRTASRFVFYLMKKDKKEIEELISAILELKKNIRLCQFCFNPFEGASPEEKFCKICSNPIREKSLLCLVEKETDLTSIEKTKKYKGLYFILGGPIKAIRKEEMKKLRIEELKERLKNHPEIKEIILALNPTPEGQAVILYLERLLKPLNKKITHLARGLPVGGELEYADEETLSSALESRR